MTSNVGFTSIEVAVTEPQRPKVGFVGSEVLLQPTPGVTVGFAAVQVITKLNPDTYRRINGETAEAIIQAPRPIARVTGETAEVIIQAPTPAAYVSNQNVDVAVTGSPNANFPWMGTEVLMTTTPAVQSDFSWMGLEFLVPSASKISLDWAGLEALIDVKELDDIPDYMDYGDVYGLPGFDLVSYPIAVSGLSDGITITLYSYDDLQFSFDGNSFTTTINVKNTDQVYLKKHIETIFADTYLIYTNSSFSGETEVGKWHLQGPVGAIMYDYNYASNEAGTNSWDNYTPTAPEEVTIDAEFVEIPYADTNAPTPSMTEYMMTEANAPTSIFFNQTDELKDAKAPTSEFDDQSSELKLAFAPISLFRNSSSEIKFTNAPTSLFVGLESHYETVESLKALFFNNGNLNIINENSGQHKILAYTFGELLSRESDKYGSSYLLSQPSNAVVGKIAAPISWRMVATSMVLYQYDALKLVDVNFYNPHLEDYKQLAQIPLYWINWENREVMGQWFYENYNRYYTVGMDWAEFGKKSFIEIDTSWMYQHLVNVYDFSLEVEYRPWIQGNIFEVVLNADLFKLADNVAFTSQPTVETYNRHYFVNPLYSYQYAIDSLKTIDLNAVFDNEKIYNSTNYVRQGGYLTPELAQDASSSYPSNITVIYQQPEGTYSYNVLYTNDVWCGDVPVTPIIRAIAWYLGGG